MPTNRCCYFFLFICYWLFAGTVVCAQTLKGRITAASGEPVMGASLFVKELKLGTAANEDGYYELKMPEGTYTCVFQCLGYETQPHTVVMGQATVTLDISLREKAYEIKEVIITDKREDPAYGIMRRAIAMAPYYMNQVSEYKADLYVKGSLHIEKISRLVKRLAKDELKNFKEGNTYVEESFNEIEFNTPNKYKQKVLKKTGSMPQQDGGGGNAMGMITISVYDPQAIEPSISPLSSSAFAHYNFRYEGFIEEDNRVINKIKIIPKHKGKQLVSGYIYIADNYWNVHSLDIKGQFPMFGDYSVQVNFGEVSENVWLPVSHRINFNGSVLGNKGEFRYTSSLRYAHITENTAIRKPDALLLAEQQRKAVQQHEAPPQILAETKSAPKSKTSQKIEKILEKENLSNREAYKLARLMQKEADAEKKKNEGLDMSESIYQEYKREVDSAANRQDTAYWAKMRPVPLMPDEVKSYQDKAAKTALVPPPSSEPKDSTRKASKPQNKFISTSKKVLWGTNIRLGKNGGMIEYRGLKPSRIGFNTVDGFFVGQELTYRKNFTKQKGNRLSVTPEAIWAINRRTVMWNVNANLTYAPLKRGNATLAFGQKSTDFNGQRGMYPFENTVASLFFRRNYMKLYEQTYVQASNNIDIANGLQLDVNVLYSKRTMLDNHSDYSFFYRDSREYSPNIPQNAELVCPLTDHTNTSFTLNLHYTPQYYYRIDHNKRKRMLKSDFPTFHIGWRKGLKDVFGSDSNYDLLYGAVIQRIETGFMQEFKYQVGGGAFVNREAVFFPDFYHFRTLEIPVTMGSVESPGFNLLEYYRYSTSDKYVMANLYYTAPFLILKYLPFFNNRALWSEGLQLGYLYTPEMKNYFELGYTIGLIWQAGVFVGFENFSYRSVGFRLSLPLGLFID